MSASRKSNLKGAMRFTLPRRRRGRQTQEGEAEYQAQRAAFCRLIRQIRSTMDFKVGSRGWCYILEPHKNLEDLARAVGWSPHNLVISRFGLNADFINRLGLTWIDNLETSSGQRLDDPRHPDHNKAYVQDYVRRFGPRKCEANALVVAPDVGRDLCRRAILEHVPAEAPESYADRLEIERDQLLVAIRRLMGASS
jgi:hypothetical protein